MKHSKNFYLIAAQNKRGTVFNGTNVAARTVTPLGTANDRNGGENPFVFTSPPTPPVVGATLAVDRATARVTPTKGGRRER